MKEEIKKGDLVLWKEDDQFDLAGGPPYDDSEQIGIVVETRLLQSGS